MSYALVSADFFTLFASPMQLGRDFETKDEQPGQDGVVVLADGFWQSHFGGRSDVVGQTVQLDGRQHHVVGVMPPGFRFPVSTTQMWKPLALAPIEADNRTGRWLAAIGRLRPGTSLQAAAAEMDTLARQLASAYPEAVEGWGVTLTPLHTAVVAGAGSPLLMLWGATALVVLIACANVGHLLLIRAAGRRSELAIRTALGAPRRRLVCQLLTENGLLSLIGGLGGLILAYWGIKALPALAGGSLPRVQSVAIDGVVGVFTLALSLAAGLFAGLFPALRLSRGATAAALKEAGRGAALRRNRHILVTAEVALAVVVLISASLLVRSFAKALDVHPGFEPQNLLSLRVEPEMQVDLDGDLETIMERVMSQRRQAAELFDRLVERVEAVPGVVAAAAVNRPPLSGDSWFFNFSVVGRPVPPDGPLPSGLSRVVTPGYFRALGIPLVAGRALTAEDVQGAPRVVVVDREMAPPGVGRRRSDRPANRYGRHTAGIQRSIHFYRSGGRRLGTAQHPRNVGAAGSILPVSSGNHGPQWRLGYDSNGALSW